MDSNLFIPKNYHSVLNPRETEEAILLIKDFFQTNLANQLNLSEAKKLLGAAEDGIGQLKCNVNARLLAEVILLSFPKVTN